MGEPGLVQDVPIRVDYSLNTRVTVQDKRVVSNLIRNNSGDRYLRINEKRFANIGTIEIDACTQH